MPSSISKQRKYSRNRSPCKSCQLSKRKCDQAKPQCSQCRKHNRACEPSVQSEWQIKTPRNLCPGITSSRPTATSSNPPKLDGKSGRANNRSQDKESPRPVGHTTVGTANQDEPGTNNNSPAFVSNSRHNGSPSYLEAASLDTTRLLSTVPMNSPYPADQHHPQFLPTPGFDFLDCDVLFDDYASLDLNFSANNALVASSDATASTDTRLTWNGKDTTQVFNSTSSAMSNALNSIIDRDPVFPNQSEPCISAHKEFLFSLWAQFVGRIAPSLTPFGYREDNPFLKYLVPMAQENPDTLIAILYFAHILDRRGCQDSPRAEDHFLEAKAEAILEKLEQRSTVMSDTPDSLNDQASQLLVTLSTLLVFCMAFIANRDTSRFGSHIEYAVILCQALFKTNAEDESFLYLAKLLGFMRNSMLFSSAGTTISAPDYLSAALEFHDRNSDALLELDGHPQRCMHFRDLDMFSGMSASMASIVYTLGMLIKKKQVCRVGNNLAQGEFVRAFESDVDGLEIRLRRHLALLNKRGRQHDVFAYPHGISLTKCLNSYNEAVFWSSWTIFLIDLKDRSSATDNEVQNAVERILDACSEIPMEGEVASLLLFPLAVGGMRTTKRVYREFVLNRLRGMSQVGITDTQGLCTDLQNWWDTPQCIDSPIAFTSQFLF